MDIFPYALVRQATGRLENLVGLQLPDVFLKTVNDLLRTEDILAAERTEISDAVFPLVKKASNPELQKALINLKRDVFNSRFHKLGKDLLKIRTFYPDLYEKVQNLAEKHAAYEKARSKACSEFCLHSGDIRGHFKGLVDDELFKKGLVLSSSSLSQQLKDYRLGQPDRMKKKDYQTERGLLRYYIRMHTKTSPFSIYTALAPVKMQERKNGEKPLQMKVKGGDRITSHVRLNNQIFKYIRDLLSFYPAFYRHLKVQLNSCLTVNEGKMRFLCNMENIDVFQEVEMNKVLEMLLGLLRKKEYTFSELTKQLSSKIECEVSELEEYLLNLRKYGLWDFEFGVSGTDPEWELKLRSILSRLEFSSLPAVSGLAHALDQLSFMGRCFIKENSGGRSRILSESFALLKKACFDVHTVAGLPEEERLSFENGKLFYEKYLKNKLPEYDAGSFFHKPHTFFYLKEENVFYEDATVNLAEADCYANDLIRKLDQLFSLIRFTDPSFEEKAKMKAIFNKYYDKELEIPLTDFYESYRRYKKEVVMQEVEEKEECEEVLSIRKTRKACLSELKERLSEIATGDHDQVNIAGTTCSLSSPEPGSYGAFLQFFEDSGRFKTILNAGFTGFGRMAGRFLHCLPKEFHNNVLHHNNKFSGKKILSENNDASVFNANMHPPMLPYKISMPGAVKDRENYEFLEVEDIVVKTNPRRNDLMLWHKPSGKQVEVFDLDFQSARGRSGLYNMLSFFNFSPLVYIQPVIDLLEEKYARQSGNITVVPRLVYDEDIVLQRKRWYIPFEELPQAHVSDPFETWMEILRWKSSLELPDEVFIRLKPLKERVPKGKKPRLDDYKPFYFDFRNPLLTGLLERVLSRQFKALIVEEMLPASHQVQEIEDGKHVSELLVQWYNYN
ncbi:lantibiotic dehydratase [Cytophagaceae bacterium ABcell3]|nr:lantibiotic dehydratase [Cytophagaceae bacterium ABcell3]